MLTRQPNRRSCPVRSGVTDSSTLTGLPCGGRVTLVEGACQASGNASGNLSGFELPGELRVWAPGEVSTPADQALAERLISSSANQSIISLM